MANAAVLGIGLGIGALRRETHPTPGDPWTLPLMLAVLAVNVGLASWEGAWARPLDSEILGADGYRGPGPIELIAGKRFVRQHGRPCQPYVDESDHQIE